MKVRNRRIGIGALTVSLSAVAAAVIFFYLPHTRISVDPDSIDVVLDETNNWMEQKIVKLNNPDDWKLLSKWQSLDGTDISEDPTIPNVSALFDSQKRPPQMILFIDGTNQNGENVKYFGKIVLQIEESADQVVLPQKPDPVTIPLTITVAKKSSDDVNIELSDSLKVIVDTIEQR